MAKFLCLPLIIFIFLGFPKGIHADSNIVINEILPNPEGGTNEEKEKEWVELYNVSSNDVDVNGWVLCDVANHILIISSEYTGGPTIVKANSWLLINRKGSTFSLNNSDETISLFNSSSCGENLVDSVNYESTIEEEKSIGRIPDGTGDFVKNLEKSPGSANVAPEPSPEPEENTKESKQSSSSKSQSTKSSPKASPSTAKSSPSTSKSTAKTLGEKNISIPKLLPTSTPSASPDTQENAGSSTKIAGFLTGAGAIFIGASFIFYFWYYKIKNKAKDRIEEKKGDS